MKLTKQLPNPIRRELIRFFSERTEIKSVILFGSRSRGDAETTSDIDLSISAPRATEREWLDIQFSLKENVNTLLPINMVRWEEASAALKINIHKEGSPLYARV